MILKPAEPTPLTATALAELARRAGIPAGVLNIVIGDPKAIGALASWRMGLQQGALRLHRMALVDRLRPSCCQLTIVGTLPFR